MNESHGTLRAQEAAWAQAPANLSEEHASGAHDGSPSRFCSHRQCVRLTQSGR